MIRLRTCPVFICIAMVSSIFCSSLLGAMTPISLERVSKERYEDALKNYATEQKKRRFRKTASYGLLGAGAAGLVTWGAYSLVKGSQTQGSQTPGSQTPGSQPTVNNQSGQSNAQNQPFWGSVQTAFKHIAIYSLAGGLWAFFSGFLKDGYTSVKEFFGRPATANYVGPFFQRIKVELDHLTGLMKELHDHHKNESLAQFHRSEIVGTFNSLVISIEKISAVLYWHIKDANRKDDMVAAGCFQSIQRLFSLCDYVAQLLENDLNRAELNGFSSTTVEAVGCFGQGLFFLFGGVIS